MPNLGAMGLCHTTEVLGVPAADKPLARGKVRRGLGQDTTTGHWR
jgi:phosphopentomutase